MQEENVDIEYEAIVIPVHIDLDSFTLAAVCPELPAHPNVSVADAIEFRMDYSENPLEALTNYGGDLPLIATNRRKAEGGFADSKGRIDTLVAAAKSPAVAAIDIELASVSKADVDELLTFCNISDTAVIVSWHDFDGTPDVEEMVHRLHSAASYGDIAKIAVTATDSSDVLDLLRVTHQVSQEGIAVATMAMGAVGRHSRIIAPLYGSRIGYAPMDPSQATAPGQYDLETMAELIEALR